MKTINDCLEYLDTTFGETYDVRFVPSVTLGGGHEYRVTVTNLTGLPYFSHKSSSYLTSFIEVIEMIQEMANEKRKTSQTLPDKILHAMNLISSQSRWPNIDDAQYLIDLVAEETSE